MRTFKKWVCFGLFAYLHITVIYEVLCFDVAQGNFVHEKKTANLRWIPRWIPNFGYHESICWSWHSNLLPRSHTKLYIGFTFFSWVVYSGYTRPRRHWLSVRLLQIWLSIHIINIVITPLKDFYTSVSSWLLTKIWARGSLLKSPGLFSILCPLLIIL